MTLLLASVTDCTEAEQALRGGADLIDLKDPDRGALGALTLEQIAAIVGQVAGRRPVSATIGDLPPDPVLTADLIRCTAATGVDYVKVGLFSDPHIAACLPVMADLATHCSLIAVLFADRAPDLQDLAPYAAAGCAGASATCGMSRIVQFLRQLEHESEAGNLANAPELTRQVQEEFKRIQTFLDAYMAKQSNLAPQS